MPPRPDLGPKPRLGYTDSRLERAAELRSDAAALADCLRVALALSPAERAEIGGRASIRVNAEFALSQMQMKTLAVYDELLGTNLAALFAHPPSFEAAPIGDGA
jgi:hypothetical protein